MAGLLAARVLSDSFETVTIVERDQLPRTTVQRKGIPQGHHVHRLLSRGSQLLDEFFPGILEFHVRRRVRALENVVVLDGHDVVEPIAPTPERVTGIRLVDRRTGDGAA